MKKLYLLLLTCWTAVLLSSCAFYQADDTSDLLSKSFKKPDDKTVVVYFSNPNNNTFGVEFENLTVNNIFHSTITPQNFARYVLEADKQFVVQLQIGGVVNNFYTFKLKGGDNYFFFITPSGQVLLLDNSDIGKSVILQKHLATGSVVY